MKRVSLYAFLIVGIGSGVFAQESFNNSIIEASSPMRKAGNDAAQSRPDNGNLLFVGLMPGAYCQFNGNHYYQGNQVFCQFNCQYNEASGGRFVTIWANFNQNVQCRNYDGW